MLSNYRRLQHASDFLEGLYFLTDLVILEKNFREKVKHEKAAELLAGRNGNLISSLFMNKLYTVILSVLDWHKKVN